MPNKCTTCGKLHPDSAKYLVNGCDKCGGNFFFFVKEEEIEKADQEFRELSREEIKEIEDDVRFIIPQDVSAEETVVLDLEAIRVIKPGKYKIDVVNLFKQKPIIIRIGPGRYELDLSSLMPELRKKKASKRR